jgi:hypothetical protein
VLGSQRARFRAWAVGGSRGDEISVPRTTRRAARHSHGQVHRHRDFFDLIQPTAEESPGRRGSISTGAWRSREHRGDVGGTPLIL